MFNQTRSHQRSNAGFTILEMLIAMGILAVVMTLVMNYFLSAGNTTRSITNQAELQDELRTAAEIIGDEVQRANYIFPPCGTYPGDGTAISFAACNSFGTATAVSLKKLNVTWGEFKITSSDGRFAKPSGGSTWKVGSGSDPILAMISPPRNTTINCKPATTTVGGVTTSNDQTGCYAFVAYYPVKREKVTSAYSNDPQDYVNPDNENNNGWVLMEYRKYLDTNLVFPAPFADLAITGLGTLKSSGVTTNKVGTLQIPGFPSVNVPPIYWQDAGCFSSDGNNSDCTLGTSGVRLNDPTIDPNPSLQNAEGSLPALQQGTVSDTIISAFAARIQATTSAIVAGIDSSAPRILVDYIQPTTGFAIDFSNSGAVDQRGATEVRITLQGGIKQGGKVTNFPGQPVEVYATPRNIAPQ